MNSVQEACLIMFFLPLWLALLPWCQSRFLSQLLLFALGKLTIKQGGKYARVNTEYPPSVKPLPFYNCFFSSSECLHQDGLRFCCSQSIKKVSKQKEANKLLKLSGEEKAATGSVFVWLFLPCFRPNRSRIEFSLRLHSGKKETVKTFMINYLGRIVCTTISDVDPIRPTIAKHHISHTLQLKIL